MSVHRLQRRPQSLISHGKATLAPMKAAPSIGRFRERVGKLSLVGGGVFAVLLGLLTAGCGNSQTVPVVVKFWAMGREGELVQKLIPEFERQNPGIRVRVQQIPWSAAHEKLLTAYAGEAMPDLFQLGNTWIPEFVALDAIAHLDSWLTQSLSVKTEDYFQGILKTNILDGLVYGIPWYVDTRLIFYRKDLLARAGFPDPPQTWPDWITAMKRLKDYVGRERYALLLPTNEWVPLVIFAMQRHAALLKDNYQYANFTSQPFREAFMFYISLFEQGLAPPVGNTQMSNVYQEFAKGYFSMYLSGPWNIGEFNSRLPESLKDKWTTTPLPGTKRDDYPGISIAGGASLVMSHGSPHKHAVWRLIEYLSGTAQQLAFYRLTGDLPALKSAWRAAELSQNEHAQAFLKQLQHVASTPKIPEWERIAAKIARYSEAVIRDERRLDDALIQLDNEVNKILEKRRWLLAKRQ
jgi:multiple sugar transport system substrate-binding protein